MKLTSFPGLSPHTTCFSPRGRQTDDVSSRSGRFPGHVSSAGSHLALTQARGVLCPRAKAWEGKWIQIPPTPLSLNLGKSLHRCVRLLDRPKQKAQTRWLTQQKCIVSQIWGLEGQGQGASRLGPLPRAQGACAPSSPHGLQTAILAFTGVPASCPPSLVGLGPVLMVSSDCIR